MTDLCPYLVSVAPMMDWTDRHCRYMFRLISRRALLYTEMVSTDALLRGDRNQILRFDASEHTLALQLGGGDPEVLAECARIGAGWGYDEINFNVGCPSDRVQNGRFGACLMLDPDHVALCVDSMSRAVDIPVTVKTRIGVDDQDEWQSLSDLAVKVSNAGARRHIVHARKALLKGLSPKQNREIPPLRYSVVYKLKEMFPTLTVIINGGLQSYNDIDSHLTAVDGVMLGRVAYQNPYILSGLDRVYFEDNRQPLTRFEVVTAMLEYIERECAAGTPLWSITRHMMSLFHGCPGARFWRQTLCQTTRQQNSSTITISSALDHMQRQVISVAA